MLALIDGDNNYGTGKVTRVEAWLAAAGLARADVHCTAYTDHASDAPILEFADAGVLVGRYTRPNPGWTQVDWSTAA